MARTKNQARDRQAESAQRSNAVKEGNSSRLDTTAADADGGMAINAETSSARERRAARRGKAALREIPAAAAKQTEANKATTTAQEVETESSSAERHMTPAAGGFVSENYYTALKDEAGDDQADESDGGMSKTPSVKSPHKLRQREQQVRPIREGRENNLIHGGRSSKGEKEQRRQSHMADTLTAGARSSEGNTAARRGRTPKKREVEYMIRVRPTIESLLGNMEELLLATVDMRRERGELEQPEAPCPAIVGLLIHGQEEYAKVLVGGQVHTREQARTSFDSIQWIAD
jgi:hypothetical protein